jgi:hypothetical protein
MFKNAATQGLKLKSVRQKLEGVSLCEMGTPTQGNRSKSLRRGS